MLRDSRCFFTLFFLSKLVLFVLSVTFEYRMNTVSFDPSSVSPLG